MTMISTDAENAKRLLELIPVSMRVIRGELRALAKPELSVAQFRILVHLANGPLNNRQLAEILGVSVAAMSRMADGLVRRGLLMRADAPHDRRQIHLALTPQGRKTCEGLMSAVQKSIAVRIGKLQPQSKKHLASGLNTLREIFQ